MSCICCLHCKNVPVIHLSLRIKVVLTILAAPCKHSRVKIFFLNAVHAVIRVYYALCEHTGKQKSTCDDVRVYVLPKMGIAHTSSAHT